MLCLDGAKVLGDGSLRVRGAVIMSTRGDRTGAELGSAETLDSLRGIDLVDRDGQRIGTVADDVGFDGDSVTAGVVFRDRATIARLPAVEFRAEYTCEVDADGNETDVRFVRVHAS